MTKQLIEQESMYDVLRNSSGGFLFLIKARSEEGSHPYIVYDGGDHALFYRSPSHIVVLDYIHPKIRKDLARPQKVLIVEILDPQMQKGKNETTNTIGVEGNKPSIIREYDVPVTVVERLTMPENKK